MLTASILEESFGTSDLYDCFGITRPGSSSEIKKAYFKLCMKHHPDKVDPEEREQATKKFQLLHLMYTLLKDDDRRQEYLDHGTLDDDEGSMSSGEWSRYSAHLTTDMIREFEKEYKGSEEERGDVRECYIKAKGDLDVIMSSIMLVVYDEEERISDIINSLIKSKEVEAYPGFTKESKKKRDKRRRVGEKEAAEAEEYGKELGLDGTDEGLKGILMKRQKERSDGMDSFLAGLEAKYAQPTKKRKTSVKVKTASASAKTKKKKK